MLLKLDGVIGINLEHIVTTDDGPPTLYFYVVDAEFNDLIRVYDLTHHLFWMAYQGKFEALGLFQGIYHVQSMLLNVNMAE